MMITGIAIAIVNTITTVTIPPITAVVLPALPTTLVSSLAGLTGAVKFVNNLWNTMHSFFCSYLMIIPEVPATVDVLTVISYSAPGCRSRIMIPFCVQGTVMVPPKDCLFLEPMIMLYVTV